MFDIFFEKVYAKDLMNEPYFLAFPMPKGKLKSAGDISIADEYGKERPVQSKATALWDDGSIKWAFVRSTADLPANKAVRYICSLKGEKSTEPTDGIQVSDGLCIDTGALSVVLSTAKNKLFDSVKYNGSEISVSAPVLKTNDGIWDLKTDKWEFDEKGPLCTIVKGSGNYSLGGVKTGFDIKLTFYAGKSWFEMAVCLINTTDDPLDITGWLIEAEGEAEKYCTGISNYKTKFDFGEDSAVYTEIDAEYLKYESNEHNPEVFYGTFFGEFHNKEYGVCATVFQAQQNFPKAVEASRNGVKVYLVPEDKCITLKSGMARQQKIQIHIHGADEDIQDINHRSTVYQMPVRPMIAPDVFKDSGVFENVFAEKAISEYEIFLISKADEHNRCYGMLNWGDSPDGGYTAQGRGGNRLVWTNNEYDFPHACMLMYARTGVRRYMDYVLTAARHWVDVDVCHYSKDPLIMGGQYEHCAGHIDDKKVVCSHQWVEGLLDCYHLTGDEDYLNTALGIGENVKRLLEQPVFQKNGQANARETGWALRTLSALYKETNDSSWLEKCDWIVSHFKSWEEEYGHWLAPYTDNTAIRVVFMISIAACSLMRYYRISKQTEIKDMILRSVDDLIENAVLDNGLFYYKELPSLKRLGNNPIILEALTYAYELTGNAEYLKAGIPTFRYNLNIAHASSVGGGKRIVEDTLMNGGAGTKSFAQVMIPFSVFYAAAAKEGLI